MKKNLQVIKNRYFSLAFSALLLVIGIVCFCLFGFNKGIDFESGLSERIQIAPVGFTATYTGDKDLTLSVSRNTLVLTVRSSEGVETKTFDSITYPTVNDLVKELNKTEGVNAKVVNGDLPVKLLVSGFGFPAALNEEVTKVNFASSTKDVSIEDIREALKGRNVNVQTVGAVSDGIFSLKVNTEEGDTQEKMEKDIAAMLSQSFGAENVVVLQSDFVGPRFSSTLITTSVKAIAIAVLLILAYIWIRFRFAYALSSVLALVHDVLMMLSFIVVFKLEVSSITIAAVLTIIGYSLNNTIVIFDRVRENVKLYKGMKIDKIIDMSVTQSMTRTIITSLTTLFAVVPLSIFSTGSIQLFALNLVWGVVIGTYSSNFLAPVLLHCLNKVKPIDIEKPKNVNFESEKEFVE